MISTILQIVNLILLIIIAVLLYKNRDSENQTVQRIIFAVLVILFILGLVL